MARTKMLSQLTPQTYRCCRKPKSRTFKPRSKGIIVFAVLAMNTITVALAQVPDMVLDNNTTIQSNLQEALQAPTNVSNAANDSERQPNDSLDTGSIFSSIGLYLIIGAVSLVTVIGNVLVITSVLIFRKLQKIPNMFIVSLASADLVMGGVVLPMGAHYAVGSKWMLGTFACDIWTSVDVLSVTASICTLCAISLDRFVAITMPFKYSTKMTRVRARVAIGIIWIISAAIAFIPINMGWWKTTDPNDVKCYNNPECCDFRVNKTYAVVSSCISFYIPLFVMVFAYSIVFKIAIQKRNKIRNREGVYRRASMPGARTFLWGRGEYRAVFTMGIIMGTFCACWLPFFMINVLTVYCNLCISTTTFKVLNWFGYANSFFNPIIYCHSKEFRRAFKRLLLCGICRDGFQQTSRASLSVSYTPTASARASVRTESSLFFLTSLLSDGRGRASKLSTTSNKFAKSSPVNGIVSPRYSNTESNGRVSHNSENGKFIYGHRGSNRFEYETTSSSTNSMETESNVSHQLLPRLDEAIEDRSDSEAEIDLTEKRYTSSGAEAFSEEVKSSLRLPSIIIKDRRSKSIFERLAPESCKRVLFKSSSYHDMNTESLNPVFCKFLNDAAESNSSVTTDDLESDVKTSDDKDSISDITDSIAGLL
ncbi:uncharacterized protein LOC143461024 [Clavelina lepadiformis]|uniref:uncharacterized protein LOC143461024 n=1 Tax=Clavelina lepadiformis TaxID=159417 RepID=UPI00404186A5